MSKTKLDIAINLENNPSADTESFAIDNVNINEESNRFKDMLY